MGKYLGVMEGGVYGLGLENHVEESKLFSYYMLIHLYVNHSI